VENHAAQVTEVPSESDIGAFAATFRALEDEIGRVVLGQPEVVRSVLVSLVAGGHVLLEGPPSSSRPT
jgi:MoxR-like ATPase